MKLTCHAENLTSGVNSLRLPVENGLARYVQSVPFEALSIVLNTLMPVAGNQHCHVLTPQSSLRNTQIEVRAVINEQYNS